MKSKQVTFRCVDHAEAVSKIVFKLHSANPVGVANMRSIIQKNGWKEV